MIRGGRSRAASAGKRKRPIFGGQDSDAVIKFDRRNPVTARKEEAAKKTAAKKAAQAKTDAAVAKRTAKQKAERDAMMAKVKKDRPMPKRPSAISLANAADPKAKRPAKPQTPPKTKIDMPPADSRGKVTGKGGRNVGQGAFTRANVTKEQLRDSGMTLRQYLNFMDREGKRPPKKMMGGGMMKSKMSTKGGAMGGKRKPPGYAKGGMMKSKMSTKGGAMGGPRKFKKGNQVKGKGKFPDLNKDGKVTQADILMGKGVIGGRSAAAKKKANTKKPSTKKASGMKSMLMPGMTTAKVPASAMERPTGKTFEKGGKVGPKGYKVGGKMKAKGGAAGGKKQKVRGAGIARKGVRPAKMR